MEMRLCCLANRDVIETFLLYLLQIRVTLSMFLMETEFSKQQFLIVLLTIRGNTKLRTVIKI